MNNDAVNAIVAALGKQKPPRRQPRKNKQKREREGDIDPLVFEYPAGHCHHCGKPGHSRTSKFGKPGCPEYQALLKGNNGKRPGNYNGALEKHRCERKAALGLKAIVQ